MELQDFENIRSRTKEIKDELAQKCDTDEDFRTALLADTQGTIESEYSLEPGSLKELKISVVVESENELIVPIGPDMSQMELSDEQLDQVAGGAFFTMAVATLFVAGSGVVVATGSLVQNTRAGRKW